MSKYCREQFFKNRAGRYEGVKSGSYVTSGEPVTLYHSTGELKGRIEHNGKDYYFFNPNGEHKELFEGVEMKIN